MTKNIKKCTKMTKNIKKCLRCGKEFKIKAKGTPVEKKYCGDTSEIWITAMGTCIAVILLTAIVDYPDRRKEHHL